MLLSWSGKPITGAAVHAEFSPGAWTSGLRKWTRAGPPTVVDRKGNVSVRPRIRRTGCWRIAFDGDVRQMADTSLAACVVVLRPVRVTEFGASPNPVKAGARVVFRGRVMRLLEGRPMVPAPIVNLSLQYRPNRHSAWGDVKVFFADSKGRFRGVFRPWRGGYWRILVHDGSRDVAGPVLHVKVVR